MKAAVARRKSALRSVVEVIPDVFRVPLPMVNVYFIGNRDSDDDTWFIVDAGTRFCAHRIIKAAEECYGAHSQPAAVVLTHGHFDHVGALPALIEKWEMPVYVNAMEFPFLTGREAYPPSNFAAGGGLMTLLSPLYPRGPYDFSDRLEPLPADNTIPGMEGWEWIHTPGHTPGHISLWREADRTLIAGDAFVTTRQESMIGAISKTPHISRPPAYLTSDWSLARRSVEKLALLRAHVAATGHGLPMYGETMQEQLDELVRTWESTALPAHRPANQANGRKRTVLGRNLAIGAAFGIGFAGAALLMRHLRREPQRSRSFWHD